MNILTGLSFLLLACFSTAAVVDKRSVGALSFSIKNEDNGLEVDISPTNGPRNKLFNICKLTVSTHLIYVKLLCD